VAKRKQQASEEQVSKVLLGLGEMAKKPKFFTLQQTVDRIRPKVLLALEQGYTHQDVVALMQASGIPISLVTLRQYLRTTPDGEVEIEVKTEMKTTQPAPATQGRSTITASAVKADADIDAAIAAVVEPSGVKTPVVQAAPTVTAQVAALPTNPRPQSPLNTKVSDVNPTRQRAMLPLSPPPRTQAPAPPSSS